MEINSLLRWCISVAVVNPKGTSLDAVQKLEYAERMVLRLVTLCQYLGCLLLRNAFDLFQNSMRSVGHRLDRIETAIDNQLYIALGKTCDTL